MKQTEKPEAIIVTGGTIRLGCAITKHLLMRGHVVIALYRSSKKELEDWLSVNHKYCAQLYFVQGDLTKNPDEIIAACASLPVLLTGLINNAAHFSTGNLTDTAHFDKMVQINSIAPMRCSLAFSRSVQSGWIINILDSNCAGFNAKYQNYRISKLFAGELTRQLACLLAPGIRVNAIAPGIVLPRTDGSDTKLIKKIKKQTPAAITLSPQDICDACDYLISARSVTGQCIVVDGGLHVSTCR